jgi:hypothetical protein
MILITNRFLINTREFVDKRFGPAAWAEVLARLLPTTRKVYAGRVDPKGTVAFSAVADILKAVKALFEARDPDVLPELGAWNGEQDLSATQRLVMKLLSVEWVLRMAAILWSQRVKGGGTLHIERAAPGHVYASVRDFSMPEPEWWTYLSGWFTCAIRFSGGRNVTVDWIEGGERPDAPARFDARWS